MNLMDGKRFLSFFSNILKTFDLFRFIGDARVRVTLARPRIRANGGSGRRYFDPNK
jgi:hypothetical protein